MNATVEEWVAKAEGDYVTAGREFRAGESPNYDAVCFHAEQCVEKLMKALLIHLGVTPPRSHDLVTLDRLLAPVCQGWSWPVAELRLLTRAAVDYWKSQGSRPRVAQHNRSPPEPLPRPATPSYS